LYGKRVEKYHEFSNLMQFSIKNLGPGKFASEHPVQGENRELTAQEEARRRQERAGGWKGYF
jgi:hypothetical protein